MFLFVFVRFLLCFGAVLESSNTSFRFFLLDYSDVSCLWPESDLLCGLLFLLRFPVFSFNIFHNALHSVVLCWPFWYDLCNFLHFIKHFQSFGKCLSSHLKISWDSMSLFCLCYFLFLQFTCAIVLHFDIIHSVFAEALDVSIVDILNCHILYVSEPTREVLKVRLIQGSAAKINHSNFSANSAMRWTCNKAFMTTQLATYTCRLIVGHIKLWLCSGMSSSLHLSTAHIRWHFFFFISRRGRDGTAHNTRNVAAI